MKTRYFLTISMILLAIMFIGSGCGGGGGDSSTPPISNTPTDDGDDTGDVVIDDPSTPASDEEKVTKLIKADSGGTVSLKNGTSLYIPPYALDQDTEISLSSVDITQFDGDAATQGGVNGLHIVGAVFEPDGTILNTPAVVRFPLPEDWVNDTSLDWYATNGNDPLDVLPTGEEVTVTGTPGAYMAEVKLSHFTTALVSYNCHSGTFRNIVKEFTNRNQVCTEKQIIDIAGILYPRSKIDNTEVIKPNPMQAFLGTYFDNDRLPYNDDIDISPTKIDELKEFIRKGRQVVIAFNLSNKSKTWPVKEEDGFYKHVAHTANLEIDDKDGTIQMRHTLAWEPENHDEDSIRERFDGLIKKMKEENGVPTLSYTYPLDKINEFRKKPNGLAFKEYVQKYYKGTIPEDKFFAKDINLIPTYNTAKIYVEREGTSQNPCADIHARISSDKTCVEVGEPVYLSVRVAGGDKDSYQYYWNQSDDGHDKPGNESKWTRTYATPGPRTETLRISDQYNNSTEISIMMQVGNCDGDGNYVDECKKVGESYIDLQESFILDAREKNCDEGGGYSGCWRDIAGPRGSLRAEVIFSGGYCFQFPAGYASCAGSLFTTYLSCLDGCNKAWLARTVFDRGSIWKCEIECGDTFKTGLYDCH